MTNILNFEAAQCERDPRYRAARDLVHACDDLKGLALANSPAEAIRAALETVSAAVEEMAATE